MNWRNDSLDQLITQVLRQNAPAPSATARGQARLRLLNACQSMYVEPVRVSRLQIAKRWMQAQWREWVWVDNSEVRYERARLNRYQLAHVHTYERRIMALTFEPMHFNAFSAIW